MLKYTICDNCPILSKCNDELVCNNGSEVGSKDGHLVSPDCKLKKITFTDMSFEPVRTESLSPIDKFQDRDG